MEGAIKERHQRSFHHHGTGPGMHPLAPTFRAETPPLPEEEGEVAAEPEDPSTELLRKVLAANREPDVPRVKLAEILAPTGSRGLPPAKA